MRNHHSSGRARNGALIGLFFLLTTLFSTALVAPAGADTIPTTTSIGSSPSPSNEGQSVLFTATITGGVPDGVGTVDFTEDLDTNVLAGGDNVAVAGGQASFSTASLAHGSHQITAIYSGGTDVDSNDYTTSRGQVTHIVKRTPTMGLYSNPTSPSTYSQYVQFTAYVPDNACVAVISVCAQAAEQPQAFASPGAPTGNVEFLVDSTSKGSAPLSGGQTSFSTESLSAGSHMITAIFTSTDPTYNGNSDIIPFTVNKNSPSITTASSPDPSLVGQQVDITSHLTPEVVNNDAGVSGVVDSAEPLPPSGNVQFFDGTNSLGTSPVVDDFATFSTSALIIGPHTLTGRYLGDSNYNGIQSTDPHTVDQALTNTTVTSDNNPASPGEDVTFTAAVTVIDPGSGTPTGTVTFKDGSTVLGTAPISGGSAQLTADDLSLGHHNITAVYNGDVNNTPSTSEVLDQLIQVGTSTVVASNHNPSTPGQSVTFTATVTPTSPGTPTGTVSFYDGTTLLGSGTLSGAGVATFATSSLATGHHAISAVYPGDATYLGSTSPSIDQVVQGTATSTALASSRNPSTMFRPLTLTATVTGLGGNAVGTVTFFDGTTPIGTANVNAAGVATMVTKTLALGDHTLSARYDGSGSLLPSTSGPLVQNIGLGYLITTSDGQVVPFGTGKDFDLKGVLGLDGGEVAAKSLVKGAKLNAPIVGLATTPTGGGYYLLGGDGGIFTFGDAAFYGSTGNLKLNKPVVGMASTPTNLGYWLVASDGGIFTFGDAGFFGSTGNLKLNSPIVAVTPTPTGLGYWLVAADGGVFTFGDAAFFGSMGGTKINSPIVGIAATPSGNGYTLVAADGGIFTFGDAGFFGSMGGAKLNSPVIGLVATPTGLGYWLLAADGGVFSFGDAPFLGSGGGTSFGGKPIVGFGYA
jgi:hypothetical protein